MPRDARLEWQEYCTRELATLTSLLERLGFALNAEQPHLGGERYLMQAVTTHSGRKLILLGVERATGRTVVIKATRDDAGARELVHERLCRSVLHEIEFAYATFRTPEEVLFTREAGYTISIQAFIAQAMPFLDRPIEEQFAITLRSFKGQEGVHAATFGHRRRIAGTFGRMTTGEYLRTFDGFRAKAASCLPEDARLANLLKESSMLLHREQRRIEQYEGFLTHTDFVPHNFRVAGDDIYLLDSSALRFGNKHEGWARFLNFMELHEPPLTSAFLTYVADNRSAEEMRSLTLMRVYRLGEIIWYYVNTLERSAGALQELNRARVAWWTHVLERLLRDERPEPLARDTYIALRDRLRTPDEKLRQQGLH